MCWYSIVERLEKIKCQSCSLSADLYNKKTHFVLEFIQNADDNAYPEDALPTLCIQLKDGVVQFRCNETGFSEANVNAICDIGGSTKAAAKLQPGAGYIGMFASSTS